MSGLHTFSLGGSGKLMFDIVNKRIPGIWRKCTLFKEVLTEEASYSITDANTQTYISKNFEV